MSVPRPDCRHLQDNYQSAILSKRAMLARAVLGIGLILLAVTCSVSHSKEEASRHTSDVESGAPHGAPQLSVWSRYYYHQLAAVRTGQTRIRNRECFQVILESVPTLQPPPLARRAWHDSVGSHCCGSHQQQRPPSGTNRRCRNDHGHFDVNRGGGKMKLQASGRLPAPSRARADRWLSAYSHHTSGGQQRRRRHGGPPVQTAHQSLLTSSGE